MNSSDQQLLLSLARESIATYYEGKEPGISKVKHLHEKRGVFVTLHEEGELRGCIGFPHPTHPLYYAVIEAARGAAFGDPRFPPLLRSELHKVHIEISALTEPKLIKVKTPEDYPKHIKLGRDGLIIESDSGSGLLLPQVAIEHHFTPVQFLNCLAQKAGLPFSAWKDLDTRMYAFQAEIFQERKK
jgi:uncharacterized protein